MTDIIEHRADVDPGAPDDPAGAPPPVPSAPGDRPRLAWLRLVALVAALVALGLFGGWFVLLIVVAIILSIFLHEMGHYLVAKKCGMKVTEFFIGFGPRLWSFRRGETEYGVKAIPAGAYVRIIGMHSLEDADPADEPRTYRSKSYPKRLATVLAGPFMNLLIGFVLLFAIAVGFGTPNADRWTVGRVVDGSAAAEAGVQPGDRLVSLNGQPVGQFSSLSGLIQDNAGKPVELVVERDGRQVTLDTTIGWKLDAAGAAALAPLSAGDLVLSVNGNPVADYESLARQLASLPAGTARVQFEHSGYAYETEVTVPVTLPAQGSQGFLGVGPTVPRERQGPIPALGYAASTFGDVTVASVQGMGKFFSPAGLGKYAKLVFSTPPSGSTNDNAEVTPIQPTQPGAPVVKSSTGGSPSDESRVLSIFGVIRLGSQAAEGGGAVAFLFLLLTVNIFLGLINLVPLLPFDGGHAAVATYEAIRGRIAGRPYRVNMAKLMPVTYAVLFLMIGIGLSSIYLDVVSPAQNPFGP